MACWQEYEIADCPKDRSTAGEIVEAWKVNRRNESCTLLGCHGPLPNEMNLLLYLFKKKNEVK
ncbi:MAG TPA: hypothetical protein DGH68_08485 [Bacteroidetes bacterium]|nr:hypothetical protein [Bacteroidota bacterium]